MQRYLTAALLASAVLAHAQGPAAPGTTAAPAAAAPSSPAKKALVAKVLMLQEPMFEGIAREIVMRPVAQLGQSASQVLQGVPADKRDAMVKSIDTDIRQYIDASVPMLRDRAIKLAPETVGPVLEAQLSEADLKTVLAWLTSPAAKKYEGSFGMMQQALGQRLIEEAGPLLNPKLQTLETKVRTTLGLPPPGAPAAASGAAPAASK